MRQIARPRDSSPDASGQTGLEAEFRRLVRDALGHLYDLPYLQTHQLGKLVQPQPRTAEAGKALRQCLLEAVESLQPQVPAETRSHAWRHYQVLTLRYVEGIEPDRVAERLSISRSELFRDLRQAVEDVASLLWAGWGLGEDASEATIGRLSDSIGSALGSAPAHLPRPLSLVAELHPSNLPTPWTSFVGRGAAIEEVAGLLRTSRLVTLTGVGGCGKTRLAVEVARGLLEEYDSAVWLVDLAPLAEPALVPNLVASALGIRDQAGESLGLTIRRQLRDRRLLLILDNCEHLVDVCARLADELLQACPGLTIVATSRESLRLPGEVVWQVPPLSLPAEGERSSSARLESEAVRLFVDRATAAQPRFELTLGNAPAVASVCRRLDGIPLALELAAARLRALSVEQISERLGERFDLLAAESRAAAPRHQTLRAALDWSHELLDEAERLLFTRVSVFSGTFGLAAVESVCSDERLEARRVFDVLSQLVERSMVVALPDSGGLVWYSLLETVRGYGWDLAEASGEASGLRRRHAEYYLALAVPRRENADLGQPLETASEGAERTAILDGEYANVRSALLWFEANGQAQTALQMASELWVFWGCFAHASEGLEHLTRLTALPANSEPSLERAQAIMNTGLLSFYRADLASAQDCLEESLAAFRILGGSYGTGHSLLSLAKVARLVGDYDRAKAYAEEARPVLDGISDRYGLGWLTFDLGEVACDQCDYEQARQLCNEAARLWQGMGDALRGHIARLQGRVRYLECDYSAARLQMQEYLEIQAKLRSDRTAEALAWLGLLDAAERSYATARSHLRQALPPLIRARLLVEAQLALDGLAALESAEGHWRRAAQLSGSAATLREMAGLALAPCWQLWQERWLAPARKKRERDTEAAWAEGQAMTLEQAVEYALQDEPGA